MCDKYNASSAFNKSVDDLKKLDNLVGRKNRSWFVKHHDFCVAQQHLDDLDTLLHTHRQVFDNCIRIQIKVVLFGYIAHHLARFINVQLPKPACWLNAQYNIFGNRKNWDQHEVLVHHADTRLNSIGRRIELNNMIIDQYLAFIRLIHAIQHAHQS